MRRRTKKISRKRDVIPTYQLYYKRRTESSKKTGCVRIAPYTPSYFALLTQGHRIVAMAYPSLIWKSRAMIKEILEKTIMNIPSTSPGISIIPTMDLAIFTSRSVVIRENSISSPLSELKHLKNDVAPFCRICIYNISISLNQINVNLPIKDNLKATHS